ncbi:MAG: DUF438 domain-containing protein [Thermoplasmata archaeon]
MLKRIIKRLHSGEDPKKVKEEFAEFLSKVTPLEIAKTEEELIKEGMPREEIRKLCDLHLKIFSESGRNIPEIPRWHPIHILMSEHEILLGFAAEMQCIAESWASAPEIEKLKNVVEHLKSSESHYVREENVLFPYLERHGITEPPQIM